MRVSAVAKHCGIVTRPERFVTSPERFLHAYERSGVIEEPITAAWRRRIAFLFPAS